MDILTNLIILNLLVIVCCIPVVTAGAAFTSLHKILFLIVQKEEGYIVRGFWEEFKKNFKQSTICWMVVLLIIFVLGGDYVAMYKADPGGFSLIFQAIIWIITILCAFGLIYIFPVLARYDDSIKNIFRSAFAMGFYSIFRTIGMVLLFLAPWVLTTMFQYVSVFALLIGFSLPAYISVYLYRPVFWHFEKKKEGGAQ